ncbi:FRG domain-containing protein [Yersinia enterocolitica]|uniref:FRG domain-containing protein n=1 Tax=Yersinia enterocolitica TaxID=630 RepID=UPI0027F9FD82|nr:FRG domain-containing protein [Yersinia enterocolitica]
MFYEVIKLVDGSFRINFKNRNGEVFLKSIKYKSEAAYKRGLGIIFRNGKRPERYKIVSGENGTVCFNLMAMNNRVIARSELYKYETDCIAAIDKVSRLFNGEEMLNDLTVKDDMSDDAVSCGSVRTFLTFLQGVKLSEGLACFYRGHTDFNYKNEPSIYRNKGLISNEDIILKELLIRCPSEFSKCKTTFEELVKMQHYSLPTRLLDITTNPLIALYFASQPNKDNNDGEVLLFNIPKKEINYFDSEEVSLISNISKVSDSSSDRADQSSFMTKLGLEVRRDISYFSSEIRFSEINKVICVKPRMDNARIIRQDGAFLLFGTSQKDKKMSEIPVKYSCEKKYKRLLIKNDKKIEILKQLEVLGISRGTVYPEIESVANYLRDKYTIL